MASLYSSGANGSNRLGRPNPTREPGMIPIDFSDIICYAVGWRHGIIINSSHQVYVWGDNSDYQTGSTSQTEYSTPTHIQSLDSYSLCWAHCGDKFTVFVSSDGKAYKAGLVNGSRIFEQIKTDSPAIFCTAGTAIGAVIDNQGSIYSFSLENNSITKTTLQEPVFDVSGSANFILALTISGAVYAKGAFPEFSSATADFEPVPSLHNISVKRVFSYNEHAGVITNDSRVFMVGNGGNGRLANGSTDNLNSFTHIQFFDDKNIIDMDMGDNFSVFLSSDQKIYVCGNSDDGRLFCGESASVESPQLATKCPKGIVGVKCGCFHTVLLVASQPIPHPGMHYYFGVGKTATKIRTFKFNEALFSTVYNTLQNNSMIPGDSVINRQKSVSTVIGSSLSGVLTFSNGIYSVISDNSVSFLTRNGYVGKVLQLKESIEIDCSEDSLGLYGFKYNDSINIKGKNYSVIGVYKGSLIVQNEEKSEVLAVRGLTYKYLLPLIKQKATEESYYVWVNKEVMKVTGRTGKYLSIRNFNGEESAILEAKCVKIASFGNFHIGDAVSVDGRYGTFCSFNNSEAYVIFDDQLQHPSEVPIGNMKIVCKSVFEAKENRGEYSVEISKNQKFFAGDFIENGNEFFEVIGHKENTIFAVSKSGNISPLKEGGRLILRRVPFGDYSPCGYSVLLSDFAGFGLLPLDEVELEGKKCIVRGVKENELCIEGKEDAEIVYVPNTQLSFLKKAESANPILREFINK